MTQGAILRGIISAAMEVVVNPGKVKANPTTPIHLLFFDKLGISYCSLSSLHRILPAVAILAGGLDS